MREQLVVILILNNLIVIGITIVYSYYLLRRKSLAYDLMKTKDEKIGKVLNKIIGIVVVSMFMFITIPSVMDIPYLIGNEFCIISGAAQDNCPERNKGTRQVRIRDEEGKVIRIEIYGECNDIYIGDELKVKYLPYTHYGCVVEHNTVE